MASFGISDISGNSSACNCALAMN